MLDILQQLVVDGEVALTETPTDFVIHEVWSSYSDELGEDVKHGHEEHRSKAVRICLSASIGTFHSPGVSVFSCVEFANEPQFKKYCEEANEIEEGRSQFYTQIEYDKYLDKKKIDEDRKHRQLMESKCSILMKKFGIEQVDSMEFFEKLEEAAESEEAIWSEKLEGMNEDGLCIGMGVTVDQWYEERNYLSGRRGESNVAWGQLRDYLSEKFPIVAAEYRQQVKVG